jgi:hypothetical protein
VTRRIFKSPSEKRLEDLVDGTRSATPPGIAAAASARKMAGDEDSDVELEGVDMEEEVEEADPEYKEDEEEEAPAKAVKPAKAAKAAGAPSSTRTPPSSGVAFPLCFPAAAADPRARDNSNPAEEPPRD